MLTIHARLEVFRRRFESGNTMALLHAINSCAEENLPLPTWLAIAFGDAFDRFLAPGAPTSLDICKRRRSLQRLPYALSIGAIYQADDIIARHPCALGFKVYSKPKSVGKACTSPLL